MTDPRPDLYRALDQLVDLATTTADQDLDRRTPCEGWDVRTLLGHVLTVERRLAHVARGGAPHDVPHVTEVPDADRAAALTDARDDLHRAWDDDAVLDRALVLPWGTMPGRVAAAAYVQESVAHAWDLAVATGRLDALDPALAQDCLATAHHVVPAEGRDDIPFGPVVAVPDDAGPYERLVAWFGRDPYDPRPALFHSLDQIDALVTGTGADQLDVPTPCDGWDVRTLLRHVVGVHRRIAGAPRDAALEPESVPAVDDDAIAAAVADARTEIDRGWADGAVLDREIRVPWGTVPGRQVAAGFTQELVVHAWDLAVVTGRANTLDPSLAESCVDTAHRILPAETREYVPTFGPVVEPPAGAGPYEQLVAWLGRDPSAHLPADAPAG